MTGEQGENGAPPLQSEGESNRSPKRREWSARNIDEKTRAILDEDSRYFLHQSVSTPCLNAIARAEGIWIEDVQGRRYMDFHGNNVHHIGYGHPRLKAAIAAQMDALPFAPRRFACEPATALARKLAEIAPGNLEKVLFATGGSDAVEIALKIARAATGRFKTISFWDSFHGAGFGAASIGGEQMFRSGPIGPLLPGAEHVPPFDCYRNPFGYSHTGREPHGDECGRVCANMVRYILEREGDIAAVIAEPNRAVPYIPPPGFWAEIRRACDDHGALLIFDEIPTGLGKTGRMFACDHDGVVPDILVLGKALGGGILPIAATMGVHALNRLFELMDRHPAIGDARGRGLLMGVELVADRDSREPDAALAEDILYRALDRGLSIKITMGNVLTLTPPLTISRDQMDAAIDILDACLAEAAA
jgi:4-aminobutyrate aminotransferase